VTKNVGNAIKTRQQEPQRNLDGRQHCLWTIHGAFYAFCISVMSQTREALFTSCLPLKRSGKLSLFPLWKHVDVDFYSLASVEVNGQPNAPTALSYSEGVHGTHW